MFQTKITENDEQVSIALMGDLDTTASKQFLTEMQTTILPLCHKNIVIDFSELDFISSSGLRTLLLIRKEVSKKSGNICAQNINDDIMQIFQLTGFDEMFNVR